MFRVWLHGGEGGDASLSPSFQIAVHVLLVLVSVCFFFNPVFQIWNKKNATLRHRPI